jgi:succinoglycan biosynthesis transport protein ExoP
MPEPTGDPTQNVTLRHYLAVLRRRKWTVVLATIAVPAAAVLFSLHQQKLYQASAEVMVNNQDLVATLTNVNGGSISQTDADRYLQTQAKLARVPTVVRRTLIAAGLGTEGVDSFLSRSSVTPASNADTMGMAVRDANSTRAAGLATEYAGQFVAYRHQLDTAALVSARLHVEGQMKKLRASGQAGSGLYSSYAQSDERLREMETLQTSNVSVVQAAQNAVLVQPRTSRNGILGLLLGLVLGLGLAFLYEALDTRVRTAEEVGHALDGLPLLARLPEPPKSLRKRGELVMAARPGGPQGEAYRMLRANLDFVTLERDAKTIMVTSALIGEGKTTTAANLALTLARAGRQVILVELDLRRPRLDALFGLDDTPGLTDVVLGKAALEDAITLVSATDLSNRSSYAGRPILTGSSEEGALGILHSGPLPPSPGEFVGTHALAKVLAELGELAETVLIDAPPLLEVGDAMTLSSRVDAMLIVTRLEHLHRNTLRELARTLEQCPAEKLGFVLTGVEESKAYGYGRGYGYKLPDGETVSAQSGENE